MLPGGDKAENLLLKVKSPGCGLLSETGAYSYLTYFQRALNSSTAAKKASIFAQGDWGGMSQPEEMQKLGA